MQQALVTVHYQVSGDRTQFHDDMELAAAAIAKTPGLLWKIWGFDPDRGAGVSAYLFDGAGAAERFAAGATIERLRRHPAVASVLLDFAPVDLPLSNQTGAAKALANQ